MIPLHEITDIYIQEEALTENFPHVQSSTERVPSPDRLIVFKSDRTVLFLETLSESQITVLISGISPLIQSYTESEKSPVAVTRTLSDGKSHSANLPISKEISRSPLPKSLAEGSAFTLLGPLNPDQVEDRDELRYGVLSSQPVLVRYLHLEGEASGPSLSHTRTLCTRRTQSVTLGIKKACFSFSSFRSPSLSPLPYLFPLHTQSPTPHTCHACAGKHFVVFDHRNKSTPLTQSVMFWFDIGKLREIIIGKETDTFSNENLRELDADCCFSLRVSVCVCMYVCVSVCEFPLVSTVGLCLSEESLCCSLSML